MQGHDFYACSMWNTIMVIPILITLPMWAASLVIDFPDDNVPYLDSEDTWKFWGNYLSQCTTFSDAGCPSTNEYAKWEEWAIDVYNVVNNSNS